MNCPNSLASKLWTRALMSHPRLNSAESFASGVHGLLIYSLAYQSVNEPDAVCFKVHEKKKIGVMALNKEVSISPFLSEVQYVVQCQGQYLFG